MSSDTQPQLLASVMLYLCAAMVGVMSYYMADRKYRMAFLEARRSLEVKLTLEEQSTQQVNSTRTYTRCNLCRLITVCFVHRIIKHSVGSLGKPLTYMTS